LEQQPFSHELPHEGSEIPFHSREYGHLLGASATKSTLFGTGFSTSLILAREIKRIGLTFDSPSIQLRQTLRMGLYHKVFPECLNEVLKNNSHKRRSKKEGASKLALP
jgi:hypothetical protein